MNKVSLICLIIVAQFSFENAKLIDLSHNIEENMIRWPTHVPFKFTKTVKRDGNPFYAYYEFLTSDHIGTHFDAPSHFVKNGFSIEKWEPENFFLNGFLIDISDKCKNDPDYALKVSDLNFTVSELDFMRGKNNILFIRTGYDQYWGDKLKYTGTLDDDVAKLRFPSLSKEAANELVKMKLFSVVGIDTLSIDVGITKDYIVHQILLGNGILGLENVANLHLLPLHEFFHVYAFPIKLKDGTGGPARVVAKLLTKKLKRIMKPHKKQKATLKA